MSANVETMAFAGATPWHGIGEKISDESWYDLGVVKQLSGLNWTVELEPMFLKDGRKVDCRQASVRSTDKSILGTVGPRYTPLQNDKAFEFFRPFLETKSAALHTAGSLDEGRRVWILAKLALDSSDIVPGDTVDKFLLLSNSHDGTLAVRVGFTPVRVVCSNTLAMAHSNEASKLIRIRHHKSVEKTLEEVRDVMNVANAEFEATAEQYRALAKRQINREDLEKYIKIVLGVDEEEIKTRTRNTIDGIINLFETGKGANIPGVRGTYWGAYNSLTEWLTWERGHNTDTRLNSLWFGDSANVNKLALETAVELAI
jgi:phage/plasmid-like protein (TIGR03299 family)